MELFAESTLAARLMDEVAKGSSRRISVRAKTFTQSDLSDPFTGAMAQLCHEIEGSKVGCNIFVSMGAMGQDAYVLTEHTLGGERIWAYEPQEYGDDFQDWFSSVAD